MAERNFDQELNELLAGEKKLAEILDLDEDRISLLAELAYMYFNEGRYVEARTLFEGLLSLNPQNPYYSHALGAVLQRMEENSLSARYYQHALKLNPSLPEAWGNYGELLLTDNQVEQALECFEKAEALYARLDPGSKKRKRILALMKCYGKSASRVQ